LVCYILFYSFENLYGSHSGADVHLDNGVRIHWNTTSPRKLHEGYVRLTPKQAIGRKLRMFTFVLLQIDTADRYSDRALNSLGPQSIEEVVSADQTPPFSSAGKATPSFLHIVQRCQVIHKTNATFRGTMLVEAPKIAAQEHERILEASESGNRKLTSTPMYTRKQPGPCCSMRCVRDELGLSKWLTRKSCGAITSSYMTAWHRS
jgi:hypothetical protein